MTKIKLCGLSRPADIAAANALRPDYVGFVFAPNSRRHVDAERAARLRRLLAPGIQAVGVFVDERPEHIAELLRRGVIDIAQLHGAEDAAYLARLRRLSGKPIWKAFRVKTAADLDAALSCPADEILLDSGAGTGSVFDWELLRGMARPYFLAGGLSPANAEAAVRALRPRGVDVSSGIETEGRKDSEKMAAFMAAVRRGEGT